MAGKKVLLALSQADFAMVENAAKADDRTVPSWIRKVIHDKLLDGTGLVEKEDFDDMMRVLAEKPKMGTNALEMARGLIRMAINSWRIQKAREGTPGGVAPAPAPRLGSVPADEREWYESGSGAKGKG
jgi:hypothetical protein